MRKSTQTNERTNTNTITGAKYLINLLSECGVETIFGYPGAPILPVYDVLSKTKKIKHYLVRHEQAAIHAAEGYARTKNKTGVVIVTSGPGFSNVVTGLANAYLDNTPVLVISGQAENKNEFQEIDIMGISKPCTKAAFEINSIDEMEKIIKDSLDISTKVPQGPVVVTIKNSVLNSLTQESFNYNVHKDIKVSARHSFVKETLKSLKNAKSPMMIIGGGARNAKQEIIEFAKLTHIPVVHTMMGAGCVDEISFGMIGINGENELNKKLQNADVIISIGTKFSNRTTLNKKEIFKKSKIYNINILPSTATNVKIERELTGEANLVLQHIIGTIKAQNILFNINYAWIESLTQQSFVIPQTRKLNLNTAISTIHEYTKKYYPTITTDVGLHQIACMKIFKTNSSNNILTSGGFGAMGYGLPAAIGSQIANPNSLVLNITGDGSFQMNMQELGTVAEYNLPIKIFIMNNSSLGMIAETQQNIYQTKYQSDMLNPEFSKIANAYGILSYNISSKTQLENALKEIFICKKPVLLNINIA